MYCHLCANAEQDIFRIISLLMLLFNCICANVEQDICVYLSHLLYFDVLVKDAYGEILTGFAKISVYSSASSLYLKLFLVHLLALKSETLC